ncbi:MAG: acyl-CoA synthetase [Gammaproteobacteria bacterium]|nr:acyl-CoA synthetase [Gammaproteobacteria bacterium]
MPSYLTFEQLLCDSRNADDIIAWRHNLPITRAAFQQAVADNISALQKNTGRRWALYANDALTFAVGLLALAASDKHIVIPGNRQPGFIASLTTGEQCVDGFLGDFENTHTKIITTAFTRAASAPILFTTPLNGDAIEIEIYTSGTTGDPKPLQKKLRQLCREIDTLHATWPNELAGSTVLGTVSHQHIYGLLFRVMWPLSAGVPLLAEMLEHPTDICHALRQYAPVTFISSPAHYKRLPEHADLNSAQGTLRKMISSGGPLSYDASRTISEILDAPIFEIFGSSETGGIAYRIQDERQADTPWTPFSGVDIRLESASHALQIRSANLLDAEWFTMADAAHIEDGQFRLLGRLDRIVKIEEKRISLDELEKQLQRQSLIHEVRTLVLQNEASKDASTQREIIGAAIVLSAAGEKILQAQGKHALNQQLRKILRNYFEPVTLPRKWRYVKQLPVNAQGKFVQTDLIALFESES